MKLQPNLEVFFKAVSLRRAAGSREEAEFVGWLAGRYPPTLIDEAGNLHYDRRLSNERTLFVAHTDTAHFCGGPNKYRVDGHMVHADGAPLGADDAAGIQVLCYLMDRKVPGYYIFSRAEEVGGKGAEHLLRENEALLRQFDRAIAFDRRDTWNVITHQAGRRCCSDTFAETLATELCNQGLIYSPDDTGIFTDTAVWMDVIPECTNLSVGYDMQHSDHETQDTAYLTNLMLAAAEVGWESLPTKRSVEAAKSQLETSYAEMLRAIIMAGDEGKVSALKAALVEYGYLQEEPKCKIRSIALSVLTTMEHNPSEWDIDMAMTVIADNVLRTETKWTTTTKMQGKAVKPG